MSAVQQLSEELSYEKLLAMVRMAETTERFDDMCLFAKQLVLMKSSKSEDLTTDERNLLSVAYKNVVGGKRAAWRTLSAGFDDNTDEELLNKYKTIIEDELQVICLDILDLLTNHLCKNSDSNGNETEVFYLKMCGDYYRYLCEIKPSDEYKKESENYYKKAMKVAELCLNETHPTRLGLALNYSVCYYEILNESEKACDLAKRTFDNAIEKLDTLTDGAYKDSTLIMQLLRDNLTLWTSYNQNDEE